MEKKIHKVLIYLREGELAPVGGPKGYNYDLRAGLEKAEDERIQIRYLPGVSKAAKINARSKRMKDGRLKDSILCMKSIYRKGKRLYGCSHHAKIDLSPYDAVHFHSTMDMYDVKDSLKEYKGKVLLTSHTPTMPCKEVYALLTEFEKKYMKWFYKKLPKIDRYAFQRADYLFFPCEEAEEPYYHEWPGYALLHEKYKEKFIYLPTGTREKALRLKKQEIRRRYKIPDNAFVIAYVGRHNEIKGYADLKKIGRHVLEENKGVYFLIAGREGPLYGLDDRRWIEAGWTDDPGSIIKAADMFILPNRETYFDLVMLEALSLGQIILASRTGGNRYFARYADTGIVLYDGNEDAVDEIGKLIQCSEKEREAMGEKNKKLYQENFTLAIFAQGYLDILHRILEHV